MRSIKASMGSESQADRSTSPDATPRKSDRRKWTRLTRGQREEIISRYRAGEPSTALALEFEVAKVTITNMLRENNMVIRRQPLSAAQVKQAILKYGDGESLARIGAKLRVSPETVRRCLLAEGVVLRARHGR